MYTWENYSDLISFHDDPFRFGQSTTISKIQESFINFIKNYYRFIMNSVKILISLLSEIQYAI